MIIGRNALKVLALGGGGPGGGGGGSSSIGLELLALVVGLGVAGAPGAMCEGAPLQFLNPCHVNICFT